MIDGPGEYNYITFSQRCIAARSVMTVRERPQRNFRPVRISVAPYCADFFSLCDFRIGSDSYHEGGPVSCTHFPPLPMGRSGSDLVEFSKLLGQNLPTCAIGMDLSLIVQNTDHTAPHDFDAIIWGRYDQGT